MRSRALTGLFPTEVYVPSSIDVMKLWRPNTGSPARTIWLPHQTLLGLVKVLDVVRGPDLNAITQRKCEIENPVPRIDPRVGHIYIGNRPARHDEKLGEGLYTCSDHLNAGSLRWHASMITLSSSGETPLSFTCTRGFVKTVADAIGGIRSNHGMCETGAHTSYR